MKKKILVIDDEELIIKSVSRLLEKNGYEVFIAKNGQDALIMAEEANFDLILADIRMPGINGVEAVREIHNNKKNKKVPAIFITGYTDEIVEKEAQELGPQAYLYKPFDVNELIDKVKKTIG